MCLYRVVDDAIEIPYKNVNTTVTSHGLQARECKTTQEFTLFDKWHGIFYMSSHTDQFIF